MKHFLTILIALCATAVHAQDSLSPGLYEAESAALQSSYAGAGWVQIVDGAYSVMESSEVGDSVSFTVANTRQLVIYRDLLTTNGAIAQVCINALCGAFSNTSSTAQRGVAVAYPVNDGDTVSITNTDGELLRLDSFLLLSAPELTEVPAPDPARRYVVLADGTLAAVDQVLSGGDLLIIGFLAAIATLLIAVLVVLAWHEGS